MAEEDTVMEDAVLSLSPLLPEDNTEMQVDRVEADSPSQQLAQQLLNADSSTMLPIWIFVP